MSETNGKLSQSVVDDLLKERKRAIDAGENVIINKKNIDAVSNHISIAGM